MVQAIPEGTSSVVPYLCVRGAKQAIEFYKAAFNAEVMSVMPMGDELIGHADLNIFGSRLYLADEMPAFAALQSPPSLKGSTVNVLLWVENADAVFAQAVAAGAKVAMPLADQFWGDRYGMVVDPFGHVWAISQHVEDLTPEETMRRADEAMANMPQPAPEPKAATKPKLVAKPKPSPKKAKVATKSEAKPAKDAKPVKEPKPAKDAKPAKEPKLGKAERKAAKRAAKDAKAAEKAKAHKAKKDKKRKKKSKH